MFTSKINKCKRCTMRKKCMWHKNLLGFNLIQLIIVIAIAAILTALAFLNEDPLARVGKAKDAERLQEVQSIVKALELYGLENGSIPSEFASSTLSVGETFVLCSASGTATCGNQTKGCLVVSDPNFLKLVNTLPVDPNKNNTADTGYYITRTAANAIKVGACDTYDANLDIAVVAKATLPAVVSVCGDGFVEGAEVCDDGNTVTEGCGNGVIESGTYCRGNCAQTSILAEICDYEANANTCSESGVTYRYAVGGDWCKENTCNVISTSCSAPMIPE